MCIRERLLTGPKNSISTHCFNISQVPETCIHNKYDECADVINRTNKSYFCEPVVCLLSSEQCTKNASEAPKWNKLELTERTRRKTGKLGSFKVWRYRPTDHNDYFHPICSFVILEWDQSPLRTLPSSNRVRPVVRVLTVSSGLALGFIRRPRS